MTTRKIGVGVHLFEHPGASLLPKAVRLASRGLPACHEHRQENGQPSPFGQADGRRDCAGVQNGEGDITDKESRIMKSPAYWTQLCYEFFLRYVWRQSGHLRREQLKAIADWIPEGSHVVDVAAGTGRFHRDVLAGRVGGYLALDINPTFVEDMRRRGIDARCTDIRKDAIPVGDVVIILSPFITLKTKRMRCSGSSSILRANASSFLNRWGRR
jgi:hypothetical protein